MEMGSFPVFSSLDIKIGRVFEEWHGMVMISAAICFSPVDMATPLPKGTVAEFSVDVVEVL